MRAFILKSKVKKIAVSVFLVFFIEIVICNFSSLKTLGLSETVLDENGKTDEQGIYENSFSFPGGEKLKNIYVDLDVERYDRAKVTVELTDEGNAYAYELPSFEVVPSVKSSGYQNIYPYGKVTSVHVRVEVPEGTEAVMHQISVNHRRPFQIKFLRVLLVFTVLLAGYGIWTGKKYACNVCDGSAKWHRLGILICIGVTGAAAAFFAVSNPACTRNLWPHHGQYQELAHSLAEGTAVLPYEPDERLLSKENPYDTAALNVEQIPYRMDYAYYEGNYYAYFGIVPELLLYLPVYLLTGRDLPNYMAVFVFYIGFSIGVFGLIWELIRRFEKKVPYLAYLLLSVTVVTAGHYSVLVAKPDIYNVAVMAGNCFTALGCYLLIRGSGVEKRRWLYYLTGSLCFSFVAGCRPQMLLYAVFLLPFFIPQIRKKKLFSKDSVKETLSLVIPVILVAVTVCGYNYARFGSPVDFGATYSLTTNDMNHRGMNLSRTFRGLFSFLFQPPVLTSSFPFLKSAVLKGSYMGKNIVECFYGGILFTSPVTLSVIYLLIGEREKKNQKPCKLAVLLLVTSLVIAVFDINAAGVIVRYMSDMAFGIMAASVLVWMSVLSDENVRIRRNSYRLLFILCLAGWMLSFFSIVTKEGAVTLYEYRPELYYEIASYFKF